LVGEAEELFNQGNTAFKNGKTLEALALFEKAFNIEPENPKYQSYLGLCIAYERGKIKEAVSLCERALQVEPQSVECYLNLGRVYLRAGLKLRSMEVFRKGLRIDNKNPEIIAELQALGLRSKPVISSLPRDHFFNKYLGKFFAKLGLR
jgi:tetratricopeptide (TPR) repeat protein